MSNEIRLELDTDKKVCSVYNAPIMWVKLLNHEQDDYSRLGYDILIPADNDCIVPLMNFVEKLKGGKDKEWKYYTDLETGQEYIVIKCAINATDKNGNPRNIKLYDPSGKLVDHKDYPKIGNMSIANLRFGIAEWQYNRKCGVSCYAFGCQLLELVEYGGGDGFDKAEGSWKPQQADTWDSPVDDDDDVDVDATETMAERIKRKASGRAA